MKYELRTLSRDKGFAAVAILSLALGIGANTAIFSLVNAVLLRSLAYPEPNRLVAIAEVVPKLARIALRLPVNARHFDEWRKHASSFEGMALVDDARVNLTGAGEPVQLGAARVSANIFRVLGIQPALGRGFLDEEDRPGHNRVAVISQELWRERFASNRNIVGQKILIDGYPHVVVGVLPGGFRFPSANQLNPLAALEPKTDIFKPAALNMQDIGLMGDFNFNVIARLKPGVSASQALAELDTLQATIAAGLPEKVELRASVTGLQEQIAGQSRRGLLLMLAAVGAVLLIVCVNLANLMLARGAGRRRDLAIRSALGASRADLIRHVLVEAGLLAVAGGTLGIAGSWWGVRLLVRNAPVSLPRLDEVTVNGTVLAFAVALTAAAAIISGLIPAFRLARAHPAEALRSGSRSATESAGGMRVRRLMVMSEVALSAVLLIAAGLLLNSFVRLMNVDKGFSPQSVIAADLALPMASYPDDKARVPFYDRLLAKLRSLPGVKSAGIVSVLPLEGESWADSFTREGATASLIDRPIANYRFVSPGYAETLRIPLKQGRYLEDRDRAMNGATVSQAVADRIFHGENPIGRRFRRGNPDERPFEIVGVVGDIHASSLQKVPGLMVYVGHWYRSRQRFSMVVRTTASPLAMGPAIRAAVHELDPVIPIAQMRTAEDIISDSVAPRRFQMTLILLFAGVALLLASLGIYGVISYSATQRRAEMGIRMALGASGADLHALILRQGLAPVAAGLAVGVAAAIAAGRLLSSLLFEVSGTDPITIMSVSIVLLAVAALACWMPARRAAKCDPSSALRYE
jgi:predicted permease